MCYNVEKYDFLGENMLEFFGLSKIGNEKYGYLRTPEGAWSFEHLFFVITMVLAMIAIAIVVGLKFKNKTYEAKNKVLIFSAILINGFELVKIIALSIRYQDPFHVRYVLPLFLCSIQLIAIPMAAFCKGRVKNACLDFVFAFGILGATFGTIGSTQIYTKYPVMAMDSVFSAITHCISGFASLFIAISGMTSMKKRDLPITLGVLLGFSVVAYIVNHIVGYNYMFLMYHDGTPYSIFYNWVGGSPIFYPIVVVSIFVVYILLFYYVYHKILEKKSRKASLKTEQE